MIWNVLSLIVLPLVQAPQFDDAHQIHWQRSLDDALILARETQRPLLVAINADGESGSERIVRERYRRPDFVASTRSFVCVVGSVFRHNPRDYDDEGRRIVCPRLGEVTCGEHIALEPVLHEKFLLGEKIDLEGELVDRISPRHALILPDATKVWDFTLLFDLRVLDTALVDASAKFEPLDAATYSAPDFDVRHRTRLALEDRIGARAESVDGPLDERIAKLRSHGSVFITRGFLDALRRHFQRLDLRDDSDLAHSGDSPAVAKDRAPTRERIVRGDVFDLAAVAGEVSSTAWALKQSIADSPVDHRRDRIERLSPGLVELGWNDVGHRTFLMSHAVLADGETAGVALNSVLRGDRKELGSSGSPRPFDVLEVTAARAVAKIEPVRVAVPKPELPPMAELERALEEADTALAQDKNDPSRQLDLGRAMLMLARRRMQDGGAGIDLLLEDAKSALAKASTAMPDDVTILLDRARVANYLSDFEAQQKLAERALEIGHADLRGGTMSAEMTEAARWLGDACARQLAQRANGEVEIALDGMLKGALSLTQAALGPEHDANDWLSLASFFGALGRSRERIEIVAAGLVEFPADATLRNELLVACWSVGRLEWLVDRSVALVERYPDFAECAWYAGYALILQAEWARRGENADGAIEMYTRAETHFRRALALEPKFRESSEHYLGLCALGRGFAHLLADRRASAADALVEAVAVRPDALKVRDGLDREGVDLIDNVLEWRESGPSPVDALEWLARLDAADPRNDFYARSISDGELREALRAFGRDAEVEAQAYLERARISARRARELNDSESNRKALAQAATITAEFHIEQNGDLSIAWNALAEAAPLLGFADQLPYEDSSTFETLTEFAQLARSRLGLARPVLRAGR